MENLQEMLAAIRGLPSAEYASERSGLPSAEHASERFDKRALVQLHEMFARSHANVGAEPGVALCMSVAEPSAPSVALRGLRSIRVRDLRVGRTHRGRVLYGTLCVNPFKISGVMTLLEDDHGFAVRVAIYNVAQAASLSCIYPQGAKVAIKEPYFKRALDGSLAVRVENPDNLQRVADFPAEIREPVVAAVDLEEERSKGNECFRKQDWHGAVIHYTNCINAARLEINDAAARNRILLAYSNRAETRLQLGEFERALEDCNEGLGIKPGHIKTLYRKGRALHGLTNYDQACEVLQNALELCPWRPEIEAALHLSKALSAQSRRGKYDISDFLLGRRPPAEVADFVGDLEIKMTKDSRGRGLFATKNINTGELFLVSNAVAVALPDDRAVMSLQFDHRGNINTSSQENLVAAVIDAANKSQKLLPRLYALDDGSAQACASVPAMELFQTDTNCQETKVPVDVNRIRDIIVRNAFGGAVQTYTDRITAAAEKLASNEGFSGLWLLPSFINHSCLPNTTRLDVGNAMFLHASKPIKKGEEISICYFDTLVPFPQREVICQAWGFKCNCKRCRLENFLKPSLRHLHAQFEALHDKALEETNAAKTAGEEFPADLPKSAEFAEVYEKLEQTLAKFRKMKEEEKNWVRASFVSAYWAGIQSNEFFPKTLEDPIPSGDEILQAVVSTVPGDVRTFVMAAKQVEGLKHWVGSEGWAVQYSATQARDACIRVFGNHGEHVIQALISAHAQCAMF
ncbi:hypothetical protein KI387_026082 [Taxus chinensis]|uniref:SET domain-containing protein n=1 Tax=Taxus chinensis TaxID=29808 RepID=A0AA38L888_TAXCH|nr:hypothetical protein KI387_026082 [Taxus chinensis]